MGWLHRRKPLPLFSCGRNEASTDRPHSFQHDASNLIERQPSSPLRRRRA